LTFVAEIVLANPFAPLMLSLLSVAVAAAGVPAKPASPAPAKSPAPVSKYERAHRGLMEISAPADEYFGRLKMSFLGINNTLHDVGITAGDHTTDPSVVAKVALAEDALKDWEKRYPRDPQLGRSYYLAIGVEKKIWVQANQQQAWAYMNRVATVFPNTYFGKLIKREIAIGFTEHYYAAAVPCQTPSPTPTPQATAVPVPVATVTVAPSTSRRRPVATPSPIPTPTPTPTASPTPEPTPSPSPEPTQLAKGLKAQVLTPPCVAPASPSPLATATPAATPVPATVSPQPPADSPSPPGTSPQPSNSPRATAAPTPPR